MSKSELLETNAKFKIHHRDVPRFTDLSKSELLETRPYRLQSAPLEESGLPICLNRNCWKPARAGVSPSGIKVRLPICLNRNCWKQIIIKSGEGQLSLFSLPICLNRNCWKLSMTLDTKATVTRSLPICLNRNCWKRRLIMTSHRSPTVRVYRFV